MRGNPNLSVRLGQDLKHRWTKFCAQQGNTPSEGIRQVICRLLNGVPTTAPVTASEREVPDVSRHRLEIRLTGSEYEHTHALASRQGMSVNQWVINLVRANLAAEPQFGMTEVQIIGESNSRLLAIGRNLNQIARRINTDHRTHDQLKAEQIETLSRYVMSHTDQVSSAIRANIDRWRLK